MEITKRHMYQYEAVRRSGASNMFDYPRVMQIAQMLGLVDLGALTKKEYVDILSNYDTYMTKFGVERKV